MTAETPLEAVLRQRAFSAHIKKQFGAPGAEPSRNDLYMGKEEMLQALQNRTSSEVAALSNGLHELTAALARQEAAAAALAAAAGADTPSKRPSSARPSSPSKSTQFSLRASPRRSSPLRSPQHQASHRAPAAHERRGQGQHHAPTPALPHGRATAGQPRDPHREVAQPRLSAGQSPTAPSPVSSHLQPRLAKTALSLSMPVGSSSPSPSPLGLQQQQPAPETIQFNPEHWARVGRSKDQQDRAPAAGVQAKHYHTFQQYDFETHAVKTVARPDTWRGDASYSRGDGRHQQPAVAHRPFSAPVLRRQPAATGGGLSGGGRMQHLGDADGLYGIVEEDPSSDVDPALSSTLPIQGMPLRQRQGVPSNTQPLGQAWRPYSAPTHSHHDQGQGLQQASSHGGPSWGPAGGGSTGRPGSAALRHHDPPARACNRAIPHAPPKPRVASAAPIASKARAPSAGRTYGASAEGSTAAGSPETPSSPMHLRPTVSFLSKCAREAIPMLTAVGDPRQSVNGGLRPGSRSCSTTDLRQGDEGVDIEPLGPRRDAGSTAGWGADAVVSRPPSPDSTKVPPAILATMLGAYENLYQFS